MHPNAIIPTKGSSLAAGLDLYSCDETIIIEPFNPKEVHFVGNFKGQAIINTGIAIEIPKGCYGRIAPRSGNSIDNYNEKDISKSSGFDVMAGVIDRDYRDSIKVIINNFTNHIITIEKGRKIAQLILEKCVYVNELIEVDELSNTDRGLKGFGSSGI